ncbi:MAG: hypothetical protein M3135_08705 [Actinomycetota bacterium]|nr:hypothetical protein [Actinomycetota bacterium]
MDDNRPRSRGRRGHYEVWFLTMSAPDGSSGYWIRHTTHLPVSGPPDRRLWFARFDRGDPDRTFGINGALGATVPPERAWFDGSSARGAVAGAGHDVRWDLRLTPAGDPIRILPRPFYVRGVLPTRPFTPGPDVAIDGEIEVDGEAVSAGGFRGHQGHVEGTRHAERWAWAQCSALDGGHAFQVLSAQGRRGPILTPFLTFAVIRIDGTWVRLRGPRGRTWGLGTWKLSLRSRDLRVEGQVTAPREQLLRTRYLDPDDTPRWCHHTDVASSRLMLWRRGRDGWDQRADLVSDGTTHAEWAGRTPAKVIDRVHEVVR